MGLGLVLFGIVMLIFMTATVLAVVGLIIALFLKFMNKNKWKRKIFLSITIPYLFLFSLFFFGLTGSIIVSETKNVDIGIGDCWYAPINENYSILLIDVPHCGTIRYNQNETLVSNVVELDFSKNTNKIYGKKIEFDYSGNCGIKGIKDDSCFFVVDIKNKGVRYFSTKQELIDNEKIDTHAFLKIREFYTKMYKEVAGTAMTIVRILSLVLSTLIVYFYCKLILFKYL